MTRSILITGCSSGIGRDAALTLHQRGWRVFAACRKAEDAAALTDLGLIGVQLDYEDPDSITAGLAHVLGHTGGTLDAVFHNGAFAIPAPLEDMPSAAMRAILEANFIGWHELTRQVIPVMRAQGHGRLIYNSSVLGFVAAPWRGAYVATKFALEGYVDTLRMEMSDTPLHISLIEPGPIASDFRKNAGKQFDKWIDWESSARVAQYRDSLLDQLYKGSTGNRFQLPASAVTETLLHALEAPRPRRRYHVTTPTKLMAIGRRILPQSLMDRILSRA